MQPITSNFFTSIGKPKKGTFLSLTRQILFLLPLLIILPLFMGIDGIMYSGPIADFAMIFWLCWYGHIQRPFRFLLGFARLLPAVAQTHPYGFRHGLGADS